MQTPDRPLVLHDERDPGPALPQVELFNRGRRIHTTVREPLR